MITLQKIEPHLNRHRLISLYEEYTAESLELRMLPNRGIKVLNDCSFHEKRDDYYIMLDDEIIGFVFVNRAQEFSEDSIEVLYIRRQYRGHAYSHTVVQLIIKKYKKENI